MTDSSSSNKRAVHALSPTRRRRAGHGIVRTFPFRPRFEYMEDRTLLSTFLVTNTADSGSGSLRRAIMDSDTAPGQTNTIDFDIPGSGVQTIAPLSALPLIDEPVLIDGFSQPGYSGTPLIELSGSKAGAIDGLAITAPDVTVRGLDIGGFSQGAGIHITGARAIGDWIYGNFLGTDSTGTQAEPDECGVEVDGGASDNLIGTNGEGVNDAVERNLLSGNSFAGVSIDGQGTDGNVVAGNWIGTNAAGDVALDNGTAPVYYQFNGLYDGIGGGVVIQGGASSNRIGTDGGSVDDAGERNVIGGSDNDGIDIVGEGADNNIVAGNFIGTDLTGKVSLGIVWDGVFIFEGASSNWIGVNPNGGAALGDEGNVISGTGDDGVKISDAADDNVVAGDKIGTDATATIAVRNSGNGVEIDSSSGNTIGGTSAGAADIMSGNGGDGVVIGLGDDNVISGDMIGTDATGEVALGNARIGVEINFSSGNTIGGTSAGAADIISGNSYLGVEINAGDDNVVSGDKIGTDATGAIAVPNTESGVDVSGSGNTIGGLGVGAANVISGNVGDGVDITGNFDSSGDNLVAGNFIGTDSTGTKALGNKLGWGDDRVIYRQHDWRYIGDRRQHYLRQWRPRRRCRF
jgi:hypothetical protein